MTAEDTRQHSRAESTQKKALTRRIDAARRMGADACTQDTPDVTPECIENNGLEDAVELAVCSCIKIDSHKM